MLVVHYLLLLVSAAYAYPVRGSTQTNSIKKLRNDRNSKPAAVVEVRKKKVMKIAKVFEEGLTGNWE